MHIENVEIVYHMIVVFLICQDCLVRRTNKTMVFLQNKRKLWKNRKSSHMFFEKTGNNGQRSRKKQKRQAIPMKFLLITDNHIFRQGS